MPFRITRDFRYSERRLAPVSAALLSPRNTQHLLTLEVVEGTARGQVFECPEAIISLGRADDNRVALSDYHLSGEHAQIFVEGDLYIFRDLRSTNGSRVLRGNELIPVDARTDWEITLHDGDHLCLGDPAAPVTVLVYLPEHARSAASELGDRLIASRSIVDLPAVTHRVEHDPASALRLYKALQPLSARLDLSATIDAVVCATFELLPQVTNVAVLMRSEVDKDRFTVAVSQTRDGSGHGEARGESRGDGRPAEVRASRSVLRRVLSERAAVITANAQEELASSESILGGKILSMVAVPLWRGDEITGLIQADNRASAGMLSERDLEVALLLGAQAALAIDNAALVSRLKVAEERLRGENTYLKRREENLRFENIIGESSAMQAIFDQLRKVVDTRATVCIEGETGTGKELIATAIHYESNRRDKMFVAQNCAALPENLLESELFGHKKGAFTSADTDKKGLFEIADGGTLFLDEIGEMPLSLQAKVLRVLQEGTIRPLGSTRERQVDARIICATNRDLAAEVEKGSFRQDLYYRLVVFPIRLPPLRERREDIPPLCEHFLKRYSREFRQEVLGFSQECLDVMSTYQWPGNIRELENEVQRLVIQTDAGSWIEVSELSPRLRKVEGTLARIAPKKGTLKAMMEQVERWLLAEALREHDNNKTRTAQSLGITREGLHKKLSKYSM
ncbi:transcriptional regulator, NifA subfamily, Fis Family [Haliangium ochraceum DSM 14365]|uniref:Transcriptional regulator, NifA subfamily, Fis Family n=1 Tax=Haliangium ochraceum (strain DSM 14365 / JCM 11303 / SMP-2) TaxID=502025 RepID=D0LWE6_HALO1|nr:transcriptional regulator, NifA subfamily, Fis Family [Haliangium ochraceum DSM 14365]